MITDEQAHSAVFLSRMLFELRERLEMSVEITESRMGQVDEWGRRLLADVDGYREAHGWNPHGFGGESEAAREEVERLRGMEARIMALLAEYGDSGLLSATRVREAVR